MILDNPPAQGEANACPRILMGSVQSPEDVIDLWGILLFESNAIVGEFKPYVVRLSKVVG